MVKTNCRELQMKKRNWFWIKELILVLSLVAIWGLEVNKEAVAFVPTPGDYHQNLVKKRQVRNRKTVRYARKDRENHWEQFTNKYGTGWQVAWNKVTDVPHRVIRETMPSSTEGLWRSWWGNETQLVEYSRSFIEENRELFRLGEAEIALQRIAHGGNIWYVDYEQQYQGLPVCGSRIRFEYDQGFRLLSFGADTFPEVSLSVHPLLDEQAAQESVIQHLHHTSTEEFVSSMGNTPSEIKLVVFPVIEEDELDYLLAWMVERDNFRYFVDARSGEILKRDRLSRPAVAGTMKGLVLPRFYNDVPISVPLRDQQIMLLNKTLPIYQNNFDQDPGWDTEGLWEFGQPVPVALMNLMNTPGHAGPPDPGSGRTNSYVYGYNLKGDYTNLMRRTYLTTPTINCAGKTGAVLRFWRWLGVYKEYQENDDGSRDSFDRSSVEISYDRGLTWSTIWSNGTGQIEDADYQTNNSAWNGWNLQTFDISNYADNQEIYLRWGMGPTDGTGVFCGWNIDDVEILESKSFYTDPNGHFSVLSSWPLNTLTAKLAGRFVEVYNEDTRDALVVKEDITGDYLLDYAWDPNLDMPSHSYDELNVYYHINSMIQYIKDIDPNYSSMDIDKKGPIKVITRWGENFNNAFWSPEHLIAFGEGDSKKNGYRNFALFADIIYHEYTHAITESFYSGFITLPEPPLSTTTTDGTDGPVFTTELDAMHEAFSDYWAATVTDDPIIGNGDIWVGHNYVRNLENSYKFPDDYGDDPYANSLILSGAMWDVRREFGRGVADTLFHFARYGGDTSFADYLASVLTTDGMEFQGTHITELKEIFGLRGISESPPPPGRVIATGGNTTVSITWDAVPNQDVVGYYVYYRTENDIETSREDPSVRRDVGNQTNYIVEGLSNETTYVLKVTAYNVYDTESEYSDYVYATPYDPSKNSKYLQGNDDEESSSYLGGFCFISCLEGFILHR